MSGVLPGEMVYGWQAEREAGIMVICLQQRLSVPRVIHTVITATKQTQTHIATDCKHALQNTKDHPTGIQLHTCTYC